MKLTIAERLNIIYGGLLQEKGNMSEMALNKEINDKIHFGSEEIEEIGLKTNENGNLQWNDEHNKTAKDFDLKPKELVHLDKQVTRLDTAGEITTHLFDICTRIKESV